MVWFPGDVRTAWSEDEVKATPPGLRAAQKMCFTDDEVKQSYQFRLVNCVASLKKKALKSNVPG